MAPATTDRMSLYVNVGSILPDLFSTFRVRLPYNQTLAMVVTGEEKKPNGEILLAETTDQSSGAVWTEVEGRSAFPTVEPNRPSNEQKSWARINRASESPR